MGFINEVFYDKNSDSQYQVAYSPESITIREFMRKFDTKNIEYYENIFDNLNGEDQKLLEKIREKLAMKKIESPEPEPESDNTPEKEEATYSESGQPEHFQNPIKSRKSEELLRGLLELEVPEIYEEIIEIRNIAREAGSRSKVAVYSNDENLDVKGACIGRNGMRIQNIIDELCGEKIDIVLWNEDITEFVKNALNPAEVLSVEIIEEGEENMKVARVLVAENQLSLAIGKKGQNSRLAARLCGVKIDIHTEPSEVEENREFQEKSAFGDSLDEIESIEKSDNLQDDYEVEESAFAVLNEDGE